MFDVGFSELLLVAVIALIVLGPERLPVVARTLGKWIGQARMYARGLTDELEREFDVSGLREEVEGLRREVDDARKNIESRTWDAMDDIESSTRDAVDDIESSTRDAVDDIESSTRDTLDEIDSEVDEPMTGIGAEASEAIYGTGSMDDDEFDSSWDVDETEFDGNAYFDDDETDPRTRIDRIEVHARAKIEQIESEARVAIDQIQAEARDRIGRIEFDIEYAAAASATGDVDGYNSVSDDHESSGEAVAEPGGEAAEEQVEGIARVNGAEEPVNEEAPVGVAEYAGDGQFPIEHERVEEVRRDRESQL